MTRDEAMAEARRQMAATGKAVEVWAHVGAPATRPLSVQYRPAIEASHEHRVLAAGSEPDDCWAMVAIVEPNPATAVKALELDWTEQPGPRPWMAERIVRAAEIPELLDAELLEPTRRLRVVAKEGRADDWAAYAGGILVPVEEIVGYGLKLQRETAARIFPMLRAEHYRP